MENSNSSRFEPLQHNGDVSSSDNGIAGGRTNDAFGVFDQSSLSRYIWQIYNKSTYHLS